MTEPKTHKYPAAIAKAKEDLCAGIFDTQNDAFFRDNFTKPGHEFVLISLLTAVLGDDLKHPITKVTVAPTEIAPNRTSGKSVRFDVCCELDSGERIDIEMQVLDQHNIVKRSLVYESVLYLRGLNAGDEYADRQPAYCINILNFELEQTRDKNNPLTVVAYCDLESKAIFSEDQKIYFLEIPKFKKQLKYKSVSDLSLLERWMAFFIRGLTFEEREKFAGKEKGIMASIENARLFSQSDAAQARYYDAIIQEMDMKSLYSAGIEEGLKETVLRMLSAKFTTDQITLATNLSAAKVAELARANGLTLSE